MQDTLLTALGQGALLLTANRRLARHWRRVYEDAQVAAGRRAWAAPAVRAWQDWVGESIDALLPDRILPSGFVERRGWRKVIDGGPLLDEQATAESAAQAWTLCQQYALPLDHEAFGSSEDTARFREWARKFEERVDARRWLPAARRELWLAEQMGPMFREVWLDGFDETTPAQRRLLAKLKPRSYAGAARPAGRIVRCSYADAKAEIEAAASWARTLLEDGKARTVGVVVQNLAKLRPVVEAVFEDVLGTPLFNISLGRPLREWPIAGDALLFLKWLPGSLDIGSVGVLLRSPFFRGPADERALLDVRLREDNLLEVTASRVRAANLPVFSESIGRAITTLAAQPRKQSPGEWARVLPELLKAGGWPGARTQSSAERQVLARWQQVLRDFASLDLVEGPMPFAQAVSLLSELAGEAIFQPETPEMPVQILEALQAAGSQFDALWALGLTDTAWPSPAKPNPFLPRVLQRELDLPHATPERELRFAREVTERLVRSAESVVFSYPGHDGDEELRPSRLILPYPESVPEARVYPGYAIGEALEETRDESAPALPDEAAVRGGTSVLTWQSVCPFRAFASVRLRAEEWTEPEPGLSALERGIALHAALGSLWKRFRTRSQLASASSEAMEAALRDAVVKGCAEIEATGREKLVALERVRLRRVLEDWIELDCSRLEDFEVVGVETEIDLSPLGLPVKARADRIDRLPNGELVLIDYKSTAPSKKVWAGERPDNLQLPMYAAAMPKTPAAIAFAQLKRGEHKFDGLGAAKDLLPGVKESDWAAQLEEWRAVIRKIWAEFQAGRADIDPKEDGKPCGQCHLHSLCRIYDSGPMPAGGDDETA
ncbi:MAG: PD-(D/E)XK nuclease family protein [Acidobacteria bacterium]|nr:PD-(D/E)XK nuclease family protein [Acidobacteriota bacterium]